MVWPADVWGQARGARGVHDAAGTACWQRMVRHSVQQRAGVRHWEGLQPAEVWEQAKGGSRVGTRGGLKWERGAGALGSVVLWRHRPLPSQIQAGRGLCPATRAPSTGAPPRTGPSCPASPPALLPPWWVAHLATYLWHCQAGMPSCLPLPDASLLLLRRRSVFRRSTAQRKSRQRPRCALQLLPPPPPAASSCCRLLPGMAGAPGAPQLCLGPRGSRCAASQWLGLGAGCRCR